VSKVFVSCIDDGLDGLGSEITHNNFDHLEIVCRDSWIGT
jgi:hypothetical protein